MFNVLAAINWLSVLLAFIAYFVQGALWYLLLFPKLYRVSLGKENEPDTGQSQQPLYIIGPAVCALIITITCAVLLYALHITSYGTALGFALLVGFGYLFTNTVNIAINPNIPRPFLYGLITGSYHLVGMVRHGTRQPDSGGHALDGHHHKARREDKQKGPPNRAALLPFRSKAEAYFTIEICCWVYSSPLRTLME